MWCVNNIRDFVDNAHILLKWPNLKVNLLIVKWYSNSQQTKMHLKK